MGNTNKYIKCRGCESNLFIRKEPGNRYDYDECYCCYPDNPSYKNIKFTINEKIYWDHNCDKRCPLINKQSSEGA